MKNLKKLLFLFLLVAISNTTFAQTFGIKAGLNLATLSAKDSIENYGDLFDMKPGFHVGVTAEFQINEMLSFEPNILLSTKGYKFKIEEEFLGEVFSSDVKVNLVYIDIPLPLKVKFGEETKFYGAAGPYIGLGFGGKSTEKYTSGSESETDEYDIEWGSDAEMDDFKSLDVGLTIGAGVELANNLTFGASYNLGLSNISSYTEDETQAKNRVIQVSLGYRF